MDEMFERMKRFMNETEKTLFLDPFQDDFFEVFTQKRMELIRAIRSNQPSSIRALAKIVDRDIKNVFNDLQMLNEKNMIDFVNQGRSKKPVVKKHTIVFTFKKINRSDKLNVRKQNGDENE